MPIFQSGNATIHFDDTGRGAPVIATHGVCENITYWSVAGVTDRLAESCRMIPMDMRGHGDTVVEGEPYGFDVETMAADIGALADHLGLEKFHLLSHATGGMVAIRYAMAHSDRLLSLIATDTGSATLPVNDNCGPDAGDKEYTLFDGRLNPMAMMYANSTWSQILAHARKAPEPFLNRLDYHADSEKVWSMVESVLTRSDTNTMAEFMRSFYIDPNPYVARLRAITCPTLVLLGEFDTMFIEPSKQLAREIPNVTHVVLDGIGHMTAIEDPDRTAGTILNFLG